MGEEWKSGKVEKWKGGKVERWKSGKVEKWEGGKVEMAGIGSKMFRRNILNIAPEFIQGL